MEIISLKSNARKTLTKQKGLYTNKDSLELFLECQFSLIPLSTVDIRHLEFSGDQEKSSR